MATPDFALEQFAAQADLATAAAQAAAGMWAEVDPNDIAGSWAAQVPEMEAVTAGAQLAAANLAEPYLEEAAAFADAVEDVADKVAPRAFAGVASDGRALASLLYQPAITSLLAIKSGADVRTALASGRATLDMITRTQVADAGRSAVRVGLTPRKELGGQIRIAPGNACNRCVILAGKWYAWNAGFNRHPNCRCVGVPARAARAAGIDQDPEKVYAGMTPAERSRAGWSYADQKAIAEGADLNQVTNIRRKGGLYVADGAQFTREGAKVRARRGIREPRKTPGQIYREAGDDRDEAVRLLREHGYLFGPAKTATTPAVDLQRKAIERQAIIDKAVVAPASKPAAVLSKKAPPAAKSVPKAAQPFHRTIDGLEDLASTAAAVRRAGKSATRVKFSGGQSAETQLVKLDDGRVIIRKRAHDWGDPEMLAEIQTQAEAELLTPMLARALNAPVARVYRDEADAVWVEFIDGTFDGVDALKGSDDWIRLGLLDILSTNLDRNTGNLMARGDRLVGYDHGFNWGQHLIEDLKPIPGRHGEPSRLFAGEFREDGKHLLDNPLAPKDIDVIRARLERLRPDFAHVGRESWLDYSLHVLEQMRPHAKGKRRLYG